VNGWIALLLGASLLLSGARLKTRLPVLILAAAIAIYVALRAGGVWSEREVGSQVSKLIRGPALYSMLFRLQNEDVIAYRARRQLLLGWGRAVYMPFNDETNRTAVPDSQWIITFLTSGLVGLLALGGVILLPPAVFTWRYPPARWRDPEVAPAAAVAVVVLLYAVDCLANAMPNPVYLLGAGGLVSAAAVNPALAGEPSTRPRCDPARAREAPLPASRWQPTR
jgi:hypothetical protein